MDNCYDIVSHFGRTLLTYEPVVVETDVNTTPQPYVDATSQGFVDATFLSTMDTAINGTADNFTDPSMAPQISCSVEFRFWFATIGIGFLCLLGLVGNTLSILVLQKDNHNRVACFLLQALACADSIALLISLVAVSFIYGLLPFLWNKKVIFNQTVDMLRVYIYKYGNPIATMAQACTVWITVLLAINRYVAICKPFKVQKWCTPTRARIQVATVIIVAVLFNIPRFFAYDVQTIKRIDENGTERTQYDIEPTVLGGGSIFSIIYNNILLTILVLAIPLVILISLNSKLIFEIRAIQRRAKRTHSSAQIHEDNITLVMIVIILILLLCHTPDSIMQIVRILIPKEQRLCSTPFYYFSNVCNLLIVVNSSTNFILYYFMRRGFRKILMKKLCGCVKGTFTSTSSMLTGMGYSKGKLKVSNAKSCPEFGGYNNEVVLKSLEELRKTSV